MNMHETKWHFGLAYAAMSHSRARDMAETFTRAVKHILTNIGTDFDKIINKVVLNYRRCLAKAGLSPFFLAYGVKAKVFQ